MLADIFYFFSLSLTLSLSLSLFSLLLLLSVASFFLFISSLVRCNLSSLLLSSLLWILFMVAKLVALAQQTLDSWLLFSPCLSSFVFSLELIDDNHSNVQAEIPESI